jgi:hypothetical protein
MTTSDVPMTNEDLMWLGVMLFAWPIVIPLILVVAALNAQGLLKMGCGR